MTNKNPRYKGFGGSAGYPKMRGNDGRRSGRPLGSMKGTGGKPPKKGCVLLIIGTVSFAATFAAAADSFL